MKKRHPKGTITVPLDIAPVTGTVTIPSSQGGAGRGLDAVIDLGMDPEGEEDCAPVLQEYFDSDQATASELHFPPGEYYFGSTVETNAPLVKLIGDGQVSLIANGAVTFSTDMPLDSILWFNCPEVASNLEGPWIENIQFQDTSPEHNQLRAAIRITNIANSELKVGFRNLAPQRVTDGTVTVESQSKTILGDGTDWDEAMAPGWIVVAGYPYEVLSVESATSLTLAIPYQGVSGTGLAYGLNWGGMGVWCEPGLGFTQYGKDWSLVGRCGCALFASAGTATGMYTGTSRIKVRSGYLNGESIADSMAFYLGPFSDTFCLDVACNSYAFFCVIADGHQHLLADFDCENAGGAPEVSGMPAGYNSCRGVLVTGSNPSDCWGNRINGYYRQVGTAIELYGAPNHAPNYTIIGDCTFRSNKVNYVPGNATNTIGGGSYAGAMEGDAPPGDAPAGDCE